MVSLSAERTNELRGKEEELGKYHSESGRIKGDLQLKAINLTCAVVDPGYDLYVANFIFYTAPQWRSCKEGFSVRVGYSSTELKDIFDRMTLAEKSIEMMLASSTDHNWDWKSARDVMRCILSLEDQTRHLYEERESAAEKREAYVTMGKGKSLH